VPQAQVHATSQPGADRASRSAADDDVDQAVADAAERAHAELVAHSDELLDEIDAVLEENVLEVLTAYVQRGGQ